MVKDYTPELFPALDVSKCLAHGSATDRGAVFTRSEVVDFILDLVGYTTDKPLWQYRILEPSCGNGEFLLAIVGRLLDSLPDDWFLEHALSELGSAVMAVEINHDCLSETRKRLELLFHEYGISRQDSSSLIYEWLVEGDFLLTSFEKGFTHVVGNPPYIRQEEIPKDLLCEYKRRYSTIYGRADMYVPFIEYSLELLENQGKLCFICSDRWMKNKYGRKLREFISHGFSLDCYVDMVDTNAFLSTVVAYPAITLVTNQAQGKVRVLSRPEINREVLPEIAKQLQKENIIYDSRIKELVDVVHGVDPWLFDITQKLTIVRRLEKCFPVIEDAGCRIGIGVATGADKVFIRPCEGLDIEDDRKLPLLQTEDIISGEVAWRGNCLVNPYDDAGNLVDLRAYPKLASYFKMHEDVLRNRSCAKKSGASWYKTIDRISHSIISKEKILIPDIKGVASIVLEKGGYYPHHNLYYIVSDVWDMSVLQMVLQSGIAALFVGAYSVEMQGGCLRFQAQYLRRIRMPHWGSIPLHLQLELREAALSVDPLRRFATVCELYGLSASEADLVRPIIEAA